MKIKKREMRFYNKNKEHLSLNQKRKRDKNVQVYQLI